MIGENIIGQTKNSGFQFGIRKTYETSVDAAWDFLFSGSGVAIWLGELESGALKAGTSFKTTSGIEGKVRVLKTESHIRLSWKPKHWENTSTLQVRVINARGKATISFHQEQLLDSEQREEMRAYWEDVIKQISNFL